jgi:hypothetical protein
MDGDYHTIQEELNADLSKREKLGCAAVVFILFVILYFIIKAQ